MAINNTAKNLMLDELATVITHISLHSGYPATELNEISGGTPAYARQSITWGASVDGEITASNQPVFDVPAGTTVAGVGYWSATTQYGDYDVLDETFAAQGTYTVTQAKINLNK